MTTRPVYPTFGGSSDLDLLLDPHPGIPHGIPRNSGGQTQQAQSRPKVFWRFVLCDLDGVPISVINQVMFNTTLTFLLNRPSSLTFEVPSDNAHFNTLYTDEFGNIAPFLSCGDRVIKGYRKTSIDTKWTLRYVGRVWDINDVGDGSQVRTTVTCYDSLQELSARIIRGSAGTFNKTVKFWGIGSDNPGHKYTYGTAIQKMIERTNNFGARPTTIKTDGYWDPSIFPGSSPMTGDKHPLLAYNQAKILPSLITITDTGLLDLAVTYLDANRPGVTPSFPGKHMRLGAWAKIGASRPVTIFGYAAPPRNTSSFTRTQSMSTFATDVTLYGSSNRGRIHREVDSGSGLNRYGAFEDVLVESSIHTPQLLKDLAKEILHLRKKPRELVNFVPLPELAPLPWDNWNLGDMVNVYLGTPNNPKTRESRIGEQRVYGYSITVEENIGEHVTAMILSADAEGS